MDDSEIRTRKDDHIRINLENDVQSGIQSGFGQYYFIHEALPELNITDVDYSIELFGKKQKTPLLISSMTGGTEKAKEINQKLARAAQKFGLAMGVGSQRAALEEDGLKDTFSVREFAPDIILFANIGAVQLNYGYSIEKLKKAVDMINADGLILHLNPLQEAIQPEGDTNFSGLLTKIEQVCRSLQKPVIVKEVGWGINSKTAKKLIEAGVSAIDIAGAGGTSWSQVERFRLSDPMDIFVAENFKTWGIPTAKSLVSIRKMNQDFPVIASGGIKNALDAAKALALGANMVGMAGVFLKAVVESEESLDQLIHAFIRVLWISMFSTGSKNLLEFRDGKIKSV